MTDTEGYTEHRLRAPELQPGDLVERKDPKDGSRSEWVPIREARKHKAQRGKWRIYPADWNPQAGTGHPWFDLTDRARILIRRPTEQGRST